MDLVRQALTARVKQATTESGFDAVGIAAATPADRFDAYLAARDAGHFADLGWLARDDAVAKRRDPTLILPGARSIVMVACNYHREPVREDDAATGRIARYALGDDYHDVLLPRLKAVVERLAAEGGEWRAYVDTGPLLEVARAAQAGLGWVGKHSLLLRRDGGSWFLLGALLTTLDLEPDSPVADHCGSCTRCLDACPTGAFPAPRVVDAGRCISYLTIERKGAIPRELRPSIGDWIFGCDICQEVCPWNQKFSHPTPDPAFTPRRGLTNPDLLELLELDDDAFRVRFKGSPLGRPKRRGLLRNVCVVLGNRGDPAAVPALVARLADPEPLVRGHAAWALGRIGGEAARAALATALATEVERDVCEELASALREAADRDRIL